MGTLKTLQKLIEGNGKPLNHESFAVTVWPQFDSAGKKCPLIADYLGNRTEAGEVVRDLVGNPFALPVLKPSSEQVNQFKEHAPALFLPVELRLKTLAAIEHVRHHHADTNCWTKLYEEYRKFFGMDGIEVLPDRNTSDHTAALRAIQASDEDQTKTVGKALCDALCVSGIPKGDPAKAFLIDTVAHLLQVNHLCSTWPPQEDFSSKQYFPPGTTWVVLGTEQALQYRKAGQTKKAETYGILGLLRLEKVFPPKREAVVGTIYPHPLLAWSAPLDQSWHSGIQNAFQATFDGNPSGYDIRWHVEPVSMSSDCRAKLLKLLLKGGWCGSSQTTAFAAAIHSLRKNIPLRSDVVASALFQQTEVMNLHQKLLPVGRTEEKTTADFQKDQEWDPILSEPHAKRQKLEKQVTELIVAEGQSHKLIRPDMDLVKCGSFYDAFQRMSLFEQWSREHADRVSENWSTKLSDSADDVRLDLFQWPHLYWEQPKQPDVRGQSKWVRKKIEGKEDQPLAEILRTLHEKKKHLLIHDGAGAGKTVLSQRMEHLFSSEQSFAKFFPNAPRPLVVRWTKRTFPETGGIQRLEDLLMADAVIRSICPEGDDRRNWIRNAMDLERVVILVDGLDEMPDEQRDLLREKFFEKLEHAHQETSERKREAKVRWIVLGRPNTIRDERRMYGGSSNWLQDSHFFRVRLGLFDEQQQDNYFRAALSRSDTPKSPALAEGVAANNPPPVSNFWEQWKSMVKKIPSGVSQRILGLPDTLREMLRLIESHLESDRGNQPWPQFRSLPDLFLKTSIPLLEKNLPKLPNLTPDIRGPADTDQQRKVIELAVCAVAFEMWIQDQRVSTRPTGNQTHDKLVSGIEAGAGRRFLRISEAIWQLEDDQARMTRWQWSYPRAKQIVMNYFSKDESERTASLSFRNRRVHEQYVARYLTQYATAEDCQELPKHVGNPEWDKLWRFVITTPMEGSEDECEVHGAEPKKYGAALESLFYPPKDPNWRRPTKLMWLADQQCRRFEMKIPGNQSNIFREARGKFREILHRQFLNILNQEIDLEPIRKPLI